jgi:pyrroline-5-carboxylate reductase
MASQRVAFVGGGNMARSLIGGLIARGSEPARLSVSEPQAALREALAREFGIRAAQDNLDAIRGADLVLLAVKPQAMRGVCEELAGHVDGAIVISIAAGITCAQLQRWLRHAACIVRCMPNTPALLGSGATGLYTDAAATPAQRAAAEAVLGAVGLCVWIEDEACMDTQSRPCRAVARRMSSCWPRPCRTLPWHSACPPRRRVRSPARHCSVPRAC